MTMDMFHFPHSWLITGFVTRLPRRVPLEEQELHTLPEYLSSPPVFSGVQVTRSLVLCVCFVYRCLSFYHFSFDHCVVCSSSIYGFLLPLSYLQTLLSLNPRCYWASDIFQFVWWNMRIVWQMNDIIPMWFHIFIQNTSIHLFRVLKLKCHQTGKCQKLNSINEGRFNSLYYMQKVL
jgi:hypothetical protein